MKKEIDILIIGAGLTGLTTAFYLAKAGLKVMVLEKENHIGGVIKTIHKDGFVYESGPNTGAISTPELVMLFDDLKDDMKLEIANPKAKFRWIWKKGQWNSLPSGLSSAIKTPLFTWHDKFKILGEPFRKPGNDKNEPLSSLVKRRLGQSYLDYAVDPFISGVYAGDPNTLIPRFALPKLYRLEQNYGSFIRGAANKRKETKSQLEKRVSKEVFSVNGGLSNMVNALEKGIGKENILTNISNIIVNKTDNGFITHFFNNNDKLEIQSTHVISTTGANDLKSIYPFIDDELIKFITNARYAKITQVVACYNHWEGIPINAFGGLMPSKENRRCLGILFPSSIFKDRAPKEGAILSIFMGGIKHPEYYEKTDEEIKEIALSEISETLNSTKKPDILDIFKYKYAIPQYEITTEERLEAIEKAEKKYPGLHIAGKIRDGIGMADRVKQGKQMADQIIKQYDQ